MAWVFPAAAVTVVGAVGSPAGVTLLDAADAAPGPVALVATTVNVYAVPLVNPVTIIGLDAPLPVKPPGDDVTVYEVTAVPPLAAGALKLTVAWAFPATADTPVGTPGTILGVTLLDAVDAAPGPNALVATTVNVYAVPLVSPVTVIGLDAPVPVKPPGDDVTVYEVTAVPPLAAGALKLTVAWAFPATADTAVGAPGTILGVTLLDAVDAAPGPVALVATTVNV